MQHIRNLGLASILLAGSAVAEKKMKVEELPAPVQKTVKEEIQKGKMVGLSKEQEAGKTVYELETLVDGKSRDLIIDGAGAILTVEQEVALDSIPAAAKSSIEKKTAGGKITKVETLTKGSEVSYEAAYTTKGGKKTEYAVKADGTPQK